mgnify:CR=1 FL=1
MFPIGITNELQEMNIGSVTNTKSQDELYNAVPKFRAVEVKILEVLPLPSIEFIAL